MDIHKINIGNTAVYLTLEIKICQNEETKLKVQGDILCSQQSIYWAW